MKEVPTTLGGRAHGDGVTSGLKAIVTRQLAAAEGALNSRYPETTRHLDALDNFNKSLGERGPDPADPRMHALWMQQGALGGTDAFVPTNRQRELLARLGSENRPVPSPDLTLTELAVVGFEDLIEIFQAKVSTANRERDAAIEEASRNAAAAVKLKEVEVDLAATRENVIGLQGEKRELEGRVSYMQDQGRPTEKPPRRTKLTAEEYPAKDLTGVYFNNLVEGRPLEISWKDDEKILRYKTLESHDVDAAIALRAEMYGKPVESREAVAA